MDGSPRCVAEAEQLRNDVSRGARPYIPPGVTAAVRRRHCVRRIGDGGRDGFLMGREGRGGAGT